MPKITRKRIYSQQEIEPRRSGFSGCNGRSTIDRSISIHSRVPRPDSEFQDNGPIFASWSKSNIRAAVSGSQLLSRLILSNEAARRDHSLALRVAPGGPSPRGAFFFFGSFQLPRHLFCLGIASASYVFTTPIHQERNDFSTAFPRKEPAA